MSRLWLTFLLFLTCSLALAAFALADPGDLDPSFDGDGKVVTDFGKSEFADGLALQPNGKVVVVGYDTESDPPRYYRDFVLARYLQNGSLDSTFGGGRVRTDFGDGSGSDLAHGVVAQPDGKLVVAGEAGTDSGWQSAVARYRDDGSLDPNFDGDGKVLIPIWRWSGANAVALQQDGRIVVAGATSAAGDVNTMLARLHGNGVLDGSFGSGGVVTVNLVDGDDYATSMALQPDGKIVTAGVAFPSQELLVARFNADGSADTSFDGDGKLKVALSCCSFRVGVAVQRDGKIVVAAGSQLLRYTANGAPDSGFGVNGAVDAANFGFKFDVVALQADGRIVVAGTTQDVAGGFQVDRFEQNGSPDPSFYSSVLEHPGARPPVAAIGLQANRKIVVAGTAGPDRGHMDFVVLRLLNPPPQTCRVPAVRGKRLAVARRSIKRARCRVGKVARRTSHTVRNGRVMSQQPKAGRVVPVGTKVRLVVSRGAGR